LKKISLSQNQYALVDDADYEWLNRYKWCINRRKYTFYAQRVIRIDGRFQTLSMHRLILGLVPGDGKETDHMDGNGSNNQRSNLRICSRSENAQNQRSKEGCSSRYKGVCRHKNRKKWQASIGVKGRSKYLGLFLSEVEAALAYNQAAKDNFGEPAWLNNIIEEADKKKGALVLMA